MTKIQKHLFVIGNPRSGTSLLRIMLNSHSKITIPPECGFIHWWYEKYQNCTEFDDFSDFIVDLKTSKKMETWQLDYKRLEAFLQDVQPKTYEALVFKIIEFYGIIKLQKQNQIVLGDKNNYYINHLKDLCLISPKAKFIFIVRDPKDVYCSYKGISEMHSTSKYIPKLSQDILKFSDEWNQNHEQIISFTSLKPSNQYMIVTYENLVRNSKKVLSEITKFLEVDFEDAMLTYYNSNDEPEDLMDWKKKTLQPPDTNSIGRYKIILGKEEIDLIESKTDKMYHNLLTVNLT